MKGKKLPDLWVGFRQGTAWEVFYQKPAIKNPGVEYTTARYTPAKPAKVCRWVRRFPTELLEWKTGCGFFTDGRYKFCPSCGGKIRVRK